MNLDAVFKQVDDTSDHEKSQSETIGSRRIDTMKGSEYPGQLIRGNPDTRVMHFDGYFRATTSTPQEYPSAGPRVLQRIVDEIAVAIAGGMRRDILRNERTGL